MNRSYRAVLIAAALAFYGAAAQAALFGDDETRKAVNDLRVRVDAQQQALDRVQATPGALINLADTIDGLKRDLADLRGQVEVMGNKVDQLEKRQKDLYVDLDNRLRKFEQIDADKQNATQSAAAEQQAYEAGLAQFKANNYSGAVQSLQSFLSSYPESALAPSAQYWIGNAYYAQRNYKAAISAQEKVVATWPDSPKAADALLNIASSQAESGNAAASRKTLQTLVSKYPGSGAAEQAKQRLAKR